MSHPFLLGSAATHLCPSCVHLSGRREWPFSQNVFIVNILRLGFDLRFFHIRFEVIFSKNRRGLSRPAQANAPSRRSNQLKLCGQNLRVSVILRSGLRLESVRSECFFWDLVKRRW